MLFVPFEVLQQGRDGGPELGFAGRGKRGGALQFGLAVGGGARSLAAPERAEEALPVALRQAQGFEEPLRRLDGRAPEQRVGAAELGFAGRGKRGETLQFGLAANCVQLPQVRNSSLSQLICKLFALGGELPLDLRKVFFLGGERPPELRSPAVEGGGRLQVAPRGGQGEAAHDGGACRAHRDDVVGGPCGAVDNAGRPGPSGCRESRAFFLVVRHGVRHGDVLPGIIRREGEGRAPGVPRQRVAARAPRALVQHGQLSLQGRVRHPAGREVVGDVFEGFLVLEQARRRRGQRRVPLLLADRVAVAHRGRYPGGGQLDERHLLADAVGVGGVGPDPLGGLVTGFAHRVGESQQQRAGAAGRVVHRHHRTGTEDLGGVAEVQPGH